MPVWREERPWPAGVTRPRDGSGRPRGGGCWRLSWRRAWRWPRGLEPALQVFRTPVRHVRRRRPGLLPW